MSMRRNEKFVAITKTYGQLRSHGALDAPSLLSNQVLAIVTSYSGSSATLLGGGAIARKTRKREPACKPGSVEGNHSSGTRVAASLERPTRKRVWTPLRSVAGVLLPYLALLQVGFAVPPRVATGAVRSYRTVSPLPARAV
jgi:hypothetical protein